MGAAQSTATAPPAGQRQERVVLNGCLSLLRCFASIETPTLVVESDPDSFTPYSRFTRGTQWISCPRSRPERVVEELVGLGRQFADPPLLAYDGDSMLSLVSRHREELGKFYQLFLPDAQIVEDTLCKLRFVDLAARLDLPAPRSLVVKDSISAEDIAQQIGLPCILKPNSHIGTFRTLVTQQEHGRPHKALRADSIEQLRLRRAQMRHLCDAFIAQEYIPGGDDCIYSFHTCFDRESRPLGYYVGRKVRTYPRDAGFSTCLRLVHHPELVRLSLDILQKMRLVGPMKLDYKLDPVTGRFLLLECNARLTLWSYLGAACGINLPRIAFDYLAGRPAPVATEYRTGVQWLSFCEDLRGFLRAYRPAGDWNWSGYARSLCRRKVYEVFAWRDPKPWIVCAGRYVSGKYQSLRHRLDRRQDQSRSIVPAKE